MSIIWLFSTVHPDDSILKDQEVHKILGQTLVRAPEGSKCIYFRAVLRGKKVKIKNWRSTFGVGTHGSAKTWF